MIARWAVLPEAWRDPSMEQRIGRMQELMRAVREVRNRYMIDAKTPLDVFVRTGEQVAADFEQLRPFIVLLAGVGKLQRVGRVTGTARRSQPGLGRTEEGEREHAGDHHELPCPGSRPRAQGAAGAHPVGIRNARGL